MTTPGGIFAPKIVHHGTRNATVHIQTRFSKSILPALHRHILWWVDDMLLHPKSFRELLNDMSMILAMFVIMSLILPPMKCILLTNRFVGVGVSYPRLVLVLIREYAKEIS